MKKNRPLCLFLLALIGIMICSEVYAQSPASNKGSLITVSGVVKDDTGELLPGVNIRVDNATIGTITNIDGQFSLQVPSEKSKLLFSYVGFAEQSVTVGKNKTLVVTLVSSATNLDEVMVVAYGSQKKVSLTGSISSMKGTELEKSPSANISNMLSGSITGISSVQESGRPGGDAAKIFVRGIGSLTEEGSSPLCLVDGVERDFNQLDPSEIESINVLKDASATAVFGVRGANGVILITTKRGNEGKASISIRSSFGVQIPTRLLKTANSYDYASAKNELDRNDGVNEELWMFNANSLNAFKYNTNPIMFPSIDWREELMKSQSFQTQHSLSISGGTKQVKYFTSLAYLYQDGLFKTYNQEYNSNFTYNRFNYRTNLDVEVTKSTSLKINMGGRVEVRNEPNVSGNFWQELNWSAPMASPGVVDGNLLIPDTKQLYHNLTLNDPFSDWYGKGYKRNNRNTLNLDLVLNQKLDFITKGLEVEVKASYNGSFDANLIRSASPEIRQPWFRCDVDNTAPLDSTVVYRIGSMGGELGFAESRGKTMNWQGELALRYQRKFKKHEVSGLLLYSQSKIYYPTFGGRAMNYQDIPRGYVGFVGRATYNYDTRYLVEVNAGYNGSENFSPENRYGLFPSLSAGWNVSSEPFMRNVTFINYLKLRASVGLVGNDYLRSYRFMYLPDTYNPNSGGYNFGVNIPNLELGAIEANLGNKGVTWETARKTNYGIDLTILNDRLMFNVDIFDERRKDILTTRNTVPGITAAELPAMNIAQVNNSGYELTMKWSDKVGDFRYSAVANYSYAKNKIIFMDEAEPNYPYMRKTGESVGTRFGRKFYTFYREGLTYPDGKPIATHTPELQEGDCVYYDLNGDTKIDTDDETNIGVGNNPRHTFGLKLGVSYKRFEINMLWSGATGVDRLFNSSYQKPFDGVAAIRGLYQFQLDGRWTPQNADNAIYPRLSTLSAGNNYYTSDLWVKDASYIRMKNIEIAYTFDKAALRKIGINSLRLYVNGYNLLTFDKLKIIDPEEKTVDYGDYPLQKVFNVGVNVNF